MKRCRNILCLLLLAGLSTRAMAALKLPSQRPAWTTSRIKGSPNPPSPYRLVLAFSKLNFRNPVEMMPEPGADRFYLMDLKGKIFRFDNRPDAEAVEIADLGLGLSHIGRFLGFQLDPDFAKNRQIYVCHTTGIDGPEGSRISRYTLTKTEPPRLDPASEQVIIKWRSGGHNGCSIHFGPADGYMYFSAGDNGKASPPDGHNSGQDIGDISASILRIDVHRPSGGRNYSVPPDNPFVNTLGARPEVWAYGLRNPWRMSFDDDTGILFVGDVGWELWEMIYDVKKGGNYGWSITEGPQAVKPDQKPGPTPILKPLITHNHRDAMSITGGYTYRGKRLPGLYNQWLYGDYVTGKIWSFRHDGKAMSEHRELLDSHRQIITFARDHQGEVFVVDYAGQIYCLEKNEDRSTNKSFPTKLSDTGLFADLEKQIPAAGVIPYEIQAEPWIDGASASRFLAIPGCGKLDYHLNNDLAYGVARDFFKFPTNTVFAKTITIPNPKRHVETQILHYDGLDWFPYNYIWNDEQTDAHLADGKGADLAVGVRKQPWRVAGDTECMTCHMARSGIVLGFHHQFTDLTTSINGRDQNQQDAWLQLDLLDRKPEVPSWLKTESPLQRQARAYLHVNCAQCHRRGGGGTAPFELRADMSLDRMILFGIKPNQGAFGMEDPDIIVPGDPCRSVLLYRMASTGGGHMPKLGSRTVDPAGLKLMWNWIADLERGKAPLPNPKPPALYGNTGHSLRHVLHLDQAGGFSAERLPQVELMPPHIYDLFERFLPESQRRQTLGVQFDSSAILALNGHAATGRKLFQQQERSQCSNCHKLGDQGREVGPDLSHIGSKYSRTQLLQSLVEPSLFIDPRYRAVSIDTKSDESFTGFIVSHQNGDTTLRDLSGKDHSFKPDQIADISYGKLSLMPEGLLQSFSPQEAADLIAFLASLK